MALKSARNWSRGDRQGRQDMTMGDLCRAIEERRIPVTRHDDEYLLTARELRRWLADGEPAAGPRRRQRSAS